MKQKLIATLAILLAAVFLFCAPASAAGVAQGTDGTELQVMQPEKLEIRLGEEWAGSEFELKTDAGKYPGVITVREDGILRLEIGGSENYILSFLTTGADTPVPGESIAIEADPIEDPSLTEPTEPSADPAPEEEPQNKIPIWHIALFGSGLIVSILFLIILRFQSMCSDGHGENDEFST